MEKIVAYSIVPRKKPSAPMESPKYYAQAQARGVMGIREMATRIQKMCTVTRSDTMAVLVALADVMCEGLASGEIVRLGDLGSFQIGLSSAGAENAEDFTAHMIRKARINFRPGRDVDHILSTLQFKHVPTRKVMEDLEKLDRESAHQEEESHEEESHEEERL